MAMWTKDVTNDYRAISQGRIFRAMAHGATGLMITYRPRYAKDERPALLEKYTLKFY